MASRKSLKVVLKHPRYIGNVSTSSVSKQNIPHCVSCAEIIWKNLQVSSVQFSHSVVSDSLRPHESQHTNSWSSLKLTSIESVMPSSHPILCHSLLPPIPPIIRVFSNESTLHMRWPKYWSFSFSIIPSKEHPGLISFRMDWLDLLAVQGTLKSLLQHRSSKASVLPCSAFFTVQLSHSIHDHRKNHSLD